MREWSRKAKVPLHLTTMNRDKLSFADHTKNFPTGTWSKCADSSSIVKFVAHCCTLHADLCQREVDPMMFYIQRACDAIGSFMKGLYEAGLWIATLLHSKVVMLSSRAIIPQCLHKVCGLCLTDLQWVNLLGLEICCQLSFN